MSGEADHEPRRLRSRTALVDAVQRDAPRITREASSPSTPTACSMSAWATAGPTPTTARHASVTPRTGRRTEQPAREAAQDRSVEAGRLGDRRVRAPLLAAILVRPQDREPLDRDVGALPRSRRSTWPGRPSGSHGELRVEPVRGAEDLQRRDHAPCRDRGRLSDLVVSPHLHRPRRRRLRRDRRIRVPRHRRSRRPAAATSSAICAADGSGASASARTGAPRRSRWCAASSLRFPPSARPGTASCTRSATAARSTRSVSSGPAEACAVRKRAGGGAPVLLRAAGAARA
jgi:hypothetical protein